ncbi:MAG: STAS domain-containing protein [Bacteroidota bacterium]
MFQVRREKDGSVYLSGVCDSSTADELREVMDTVNASCTVDFGGLEYISSAGLGILLATQKRLAPRGGKLKLANLGGAIREIFLLARFDAIFEMEDSPQK